MKICRRCNINKCIDDYYVHSRMRDGHLNICKICTGKRIKLYWEDGRGKIVDRKRSLSPARRDYVRKISKKMKVKHAFKCKARSKFWSAYRAGKVDKLPCRYCGTTVGRVEAHHEDYNKPLDVIWLCSKHHRDYEKGKIILI